ncbi:hypothetical protein FRC01_013492 [Tulasnella sp. 417]|nr:hypothetical protein FRC01_013492 [Tulasnella sp. 417]
MGSPHNDQTTPTAINFSAGIFRGLSLQEEDNHTPEQVVAATARPPGQRPLFLDDEADRIDDADEAAEANGMFYPREGSRDIAIHPALYDKYANKEDDPDAGVEVEGMLHGHAEMELSAELDQAEDQPQKKQQKESEDKLDDLDFSISSS